MKTLNYCLLGLGMLLIVSCTKTETQSKNGIPVVDVTKTYPKKEIKLQDIADVEYIPLETRDDVLLDTYYHICTISPDSLLVGNYEEGSVFLFNGQGKVLQKFNHKGQSGREYNEIWGLYYDEVAHEIFVLDTSIQVYDDTGNYKRTIPIAKKYSFSSPEIVSYNNDAFLCYNNENVYNNAKKDSINKPVKPYILISKKDGKELSQLPIVCRKRVTPSIVKRYPNGNISMSTRYMQSITIDRPNFILSDISKDTIFSYSKDKKLVPMVVRTPEVLKMGNPVSFLQIEKQTKEYLFGQITKKNTEKRPHFSSKRILIDKKDNAVYEYELVNTDAPTSTFGENSVFNNQGAVFLSIDTLKEWLEEGKLKDKLKEIVENLNEDDNPVWVKIQFKK